MDKSIKTEGLIFPDCPIRNVLARIGDKWSMLIMHALISNNSPLRFSQLQRDLPDISQKVLTRTLRTMEEDGFVTRTIYAEVPPRVEYELTHRAKSFMDAARPIFDWAIKNMPDIIRDRENHKN